MLKILALQMLENTDSEPMMMTTDSAQSIHCTYCSTLSMACGTNQTMAVEIPLFE